MVEPVVTVFNLGLILFVVGWLIQVDAVRRGQRHIKHGFLICIAVGLLLIIIHGLLSGLFFVPALYLLVLLFVLVILFRIVPAK